MTLGDVIEQAQLVKELDTIFDKLMWAKLVISRNAPQDNVINRNSVKIDLTIFELEMFENLAKTGQFHELQNKIRNYINRVEGVTAPLEQRLLFITYDEGICVLAGLRLLKERNVNLISYVQDLESYILNYLIR